MLELPWLANLTDREFDLLKTVVDKGALAAILALGGFVLALLMERYRAYLVGRTELLKFALPEIQKLMRRADELQKDAHDTMGRLTAELKLWEDWIARVVAHQRQPRDRDAPTTGSPELLLGTPLLGGVTLGEHLRTQAANLGLAEAFDRISFPQDSNFLGHLIKIYRLRWSGDAERIHLENDFRRHLRRQATAGERDAFSARAKQFLLDALTVIYPVSKRASERLSDITIWLIDEVNSYPRPLSPYSARNTVIDIYFAMMTQLSQAITRRS